MGITRIGAIGHHADQSLITVLLYSTRNLKTLIGYISRMRIYKSGERGRGDSMMAVIIIPFSG